MLRTRLVHLICWQVAILSSPPVNEPVSHVQHQKTLTSCFPGPVWGCSDPGWGLSGPQRAVAISPPFFFSGHYAVTFCWRSKPRQMHPGSSGARDWWQHPKMWSLLGKDKSQTQKTEAACVSQLGRQEEGSQSVSNPLTGAFREQAENWPGLTGRAYWAPAATLTSRPLLASALNPAAVWTKRLWLWLNLKKQDSLEWFRSRNQLCEEMCHNSERRAAMFVWIFLT